MANVVNVFDSDMLEFGGGILNSPPGRAFDEPGTLSAQALRLAPGAVREPHVHPNAEQIHVVVAGSGRLGVVGPGGESRTDDLGVGDCSTVPQGQPHWVENTGDEELRVVVLLSAPDPQTIDLSEVLAAVPNESLAKALDAPQDAIDALPTGRVGIGAGSG